MTPAFFLALALAAEPAAAPAPPLIAALAAETARTISRLRTEGFDPPYYASASVTDREVLTIEAAGEALLAPKESHVRVLRVTVRTGGHEVDNSGFLDASGGFGSGEVVASLPLDDDELAVRRTLWLAFDQAYKAAGATLAAKKAFLATQAASTKESLGDFTREEPRRERGPIPSIAADRARLEPLLRQLSAELAGPDQPAARLRLSLSARRLTFVDSEGAELDGGTGFAALEGAAWAEAADGMPVRELVMRYAPALDGLGSPAALAGEIRAMLVSVKAQVAAPALLEPYHGPVLFEGDASAQLFLSLLLPRLVEPREPLGGRGPAGEWASRGGSKVLAPILSLTDDPTLASHGGQPLTGGYRFDLEGVFARPVALVVNGVLKDFVGTRWPRKASPRSNGHARLSGGAPWNLGAVAMPSSLVITAGEGAVSAAAARERLLAEIRSRELPFGLIVRRLADSSILQLSATDWFELSDLHQRMNGSSELEMPVRIFRLTPDGKEERIRGAHFGQVRAEALKDLLAVSAPDSSAAVYNSVITFDLGYTALGPVSGAFLPLSIVAPGAVVVEDAEIRPISGPFARKPLAAARTQAAARGVK
jgi:hypothetical protein